MYIKIPKNRISKIAIVKTDCKLYLSQVIAQQKCDYAINGGFVIFCDPLLILLSIVHYRRT